MQTFSNDIDNKYMFVEEAVEIRIESLKIKLENICEELKQKLERSREGVRK